MVAILFLVVQLAGARPSSNTCTNPPIRREWRALQAEERDDFIRAIKCIANAPSVWQVNRTIYDDIAILHGGVGNLCTSPSRTK